MGAAVPVQDGFGRQRLKNSEALRGQGVWLALAGQDADPEHDRRRADALWRIGQGFDTAAICLDVPPTMSREMDGDRFEKSLIQPPQRRNYSDGFTRCRMPHTARSLMGADERLARTAAGLPAWRNRFLMFD